ncbi:MAG: hypothetical protein QM808_05075 [Steroidobacteraceae bacterium]
MINHASTRSLVSCCAVIVALSYCSSSWAQIEPPTDEDLAAVPAGFLDIVRGKGAVINRGQRDKNAPPRPAGPASSNDPRDFSGNWKANDFGGPIEQSFEAGQRPGPRILSKYELSRFCMVYPAVTSIAGEIFQTPQQLTIVYDGNNTNVVRVRRIRLNGEHPAKVTPTYGGDSVAKWEGNTLVVDTVGIKGTFGYAGTNIHIPGKDIYDQPIKKGEKLPPPDKALDLSVVMATPTLHVVERITKSDDRTSLRNEVTFMDTATNMTQYKITSDYSFAKPGEYVENICEDGNDLYGVGYLGEGDAQ